MVASRHRHRPYFRCSTQIEVPKSFLDITRRFEDLAVALNAVTTFSEEAVGRVVHMHIVMHKYARAHVAPHLVCVFIYSFGIDAHEDAQTLVHN